MILFLRRARRLFWRNFGNVGEGPRGECLEYYSNPEPNFEKMKRKYDKASDKFKHNLRVRKRT
ncbi:MAG: hypothetical protein Q8L47_05035 [bacterium]|nr:hypothetical protein [bacterium]